jgi:hypothetical protein
MEYGRIGMRFDQPIPVRSSSWIQNIQVPNLNGRVAANREISRRLVILDN